MVFPIYIVGLLLGSTGPVSPGLKNVNCFISVYITYTKLALVVGVEPTAHEFRIHRSADELHKQ